MEIITKEKAKLLNQNWYFTGKPCKRGHVDKRYLNSGICYTCQRERNSGYYHADKEHYSLKAHESYERHKEKRLLAINLWAKNNRETSNKIKYKYKQTHSKKYKKYNKEYNKRKRADPNVRLSKNISKAIWSTLKGKKCRNTWSTFVNFSFDELRQHLESKFTPEMTWENYGSYWHVDHIRPLSWFDLEKEFNQAWDLSNLQPLEASKNYSKCNRYEG